MRPYQTFNESHYSEELILFNPLVSPMLKELTIARLITSGLVSQLFGNIVTFESFEEAWIFKGLSKFLEYHLNEANEMFISEVLHPALHEQQFSSKFPFSVDDALSEAAAKKGELHFTKVSMSLHVKHFHPSLFQLLALFE